VLPEIEKPKKGRRKVFSIIGEIGGGKDRRSGIIDVAVMQSLNTKGEVNACIKEYGMVIVDECHHISAFSFEEVIKAANARYVYGLTATPTRQDGHHPIIFMHCGPIRFKVDARSQANIRPFEHIMIPRFTSFRMSPRLTGEAWSIQEIYTALTINEARNNIIIGDVIRCVFEGRSPIILADRTAHVLHIAERLEEKIMNVIVLTGGMGAKQRMQLKEQLSAVPEDEPRVIVATGKYIGEGFDDARLDTLFLVSPIAWQGTLQQYVGRLHRLHENKKEVRVYDYVDLHENVLEKMYNKRLKGYASAGYSTKALDINGSEVGILYDQNSFWQTYNTDLSVVYDEILIASPFMSERRVKQMLSTLTPLIINGIRITVITRPVSDSNEKDKNITEKLLAMMYETGINIIFKEQMHQKYTVIDRSIVWYGSINILSFGRGEESIMRLQNRELAIELADFGRQG
jgi:hypothetical protein